MIGKAVDGDDCQQRHAHGLMILGKIRARVVEDLMALVGEKRRRSGQKTLVRVRGGIINIARGRMSPKEVTPVAPWGGEETPQCPKPGGGERSSPTPLDWRMGDSRD
jgi:hypothetical protein